MNDYARIERVIRYLDENFRQQPTLSELAENIGVSEYHFHRLFSRWAGVTPKAFLQCLTQENARRALREGASVLDASLDSGLSGPGRLHDLCVKLEAATPGELKSGGKGWLIEYGVCDSPFGLVLLAIGPRGICHVSFVDTSEVEKAVDQLEADWSSADFAQNDKKISNSCSQIFGTIRRERESAPLSVYVRGTDFRLRVWRALIQLEPGEVTTYGRLAESIGKPGAARAVGSAVGKNELAYLIPCHRVIRESGAIGGYRWGDSRKKALLAREALEVVKSAG